MVAIKSMCDLIVAVKFLLGVFLPVHSSTSSWCFVQYTIGQLVALLSCCYNALITISLYVVFSRFSRAPLVDIEWVISLRNQLLMLFFCIGMWLIPLHSHQWGQMSTNHGDCWIPDHEDTPGHNIYRLTFFVPIVIFNIFALRLLLLVYNRQSLFQNENRFLLVRLAFFVTIFLIQWLCYFGAALVEYLSEDVDIVVNFYSTLLSSAGLLNWLVWSSRPACIYKVGICFCRGDKQSWYTSKDAIGKSRMLTGSVDIASSSSPGLVYSDSDPRPLLHSSPRDYLVGNGDVGTPPTIDGNRNYSTARMNSPQGRGVNFDDSEILSPSALDDSMESGTPREQWIVENMRQEALDKAKNAEISLLSDDSGWDRV